jgi:hypothetical protein
VTLLLLVPLTTIYEFTLIPVPTGSVHTTRVDVHWPLDTGHILLPTYSVPDVPNDVPENVSSTPPAVLPVVGDSGAVDGDMPLINGGLYLNPLVTADWPLTVTVMVKPLPWDAGTKHTTVA